MKDEFGGTVLEQVESRDEFGGTVIGVAPAEDTGWETETPIEKSAREFEADKQFTPPTSPGFFRSFGRQFIHPFKAAGMGAGTMLLDDDTLKSHLLEEWAKSEQEQTPTGMGTLGGTLGGIGGSIANYIMASSRGGKLVGPALAFGSMGAYDAFTRAGIQALNEGKDPDTALKIAKAMAPVGGAVGAATTLAFPSVGAKTLTAAAKQGIAPAVASGAGIVAQNIAQRGLGLETPVFEGVPESVGTMALLPPGAHLAGMALRGIPRLMPRPTPATVPPAIVRPRTPVPRPAEAIPPPVPAPEAAPVALAPPAAAQQRMNFTPKGPVEVLEVNQKKGTALVKLWGVPDAKPEVMDLRDIINRPLREGELNAIQERIAAKVPVRQAPEAGQEVGGQVRKPEEPAQAQPERAVQGEELPLGDVELNERQRLTRERDRIGKQLLEKPDDPILLAEEAKVYSMMGEFDRAQESLDLAEQTLNLHPKGYGAKAIESAKKILKGRKRVTEEADATERMALDEGEQIGMDSVVTDAMPTGEPFAPGVLATRDNQGRIVWNRAELKRLREMPEGKRRRVIKAVGNEEWIHSFVNNFIAKDWFDNMTALEQAAARRRYSGDWRGKVPGEAPGTTRILSDAEIGHESIRARMQQLLGVEPTEVAMGKGWEWMTSKALLELERIVFNIRRMIGTKASKRQMEILDDIDVRIQAGKQRLGMEPKPAAMTKQEQEKTPEAQSAKDVGWTFDAYWDLPDGRRMMQFTKRQDPQHPAYGATFYLPDGATPEQIRTRAFEKEVEFGAEPKPAAFMKPEPERPRPSANFWLTPTAEFRNVPKEGHFEYATKAASWLPRRDSHTYRNMYKNGFVRGTFDAPTRTMTLDSGGLPIAPSLLREVTNMAIEGGYSVVHETPGAPRPTRMIYDASAEAVPAARRKVKPGEGQEELPLFGKPPPSPQPKGQQELFQPEAPKPPAPEKPLVPRQVPAQGELPAQPEPAEGKLPFGYVPEPGPRPADFEADARAFISEGDKVSFDTFVKTMRDKYGRMKIQPGHVQQLFKDAVWPTLLRLPGKRIKELVQKMRVSEGGMKTGVGAQRTMIDVIGKKEIPDAPPERVVQRLLTLGERMPFKGRTPAASLAGLSYGQRLRQKAIAAIGEKLLGQADSIKADLTRESVSPDEIAFYHDRVTFEPAYRPVSLEEQTNPNLGRILTDEGRVSGQNESVTRRLTAVLNTDTGAVHLLSTYRTGEKVAYIMEPGSLKARPNIPLKDFLARTGRNGQRLYRVMDSYLLDEPVQNFSQRFESVKEYRNTFKREAAALAREAEEMLYPVEERVTFTKKNLKVTAHEEDLPSIIRTGQPITDQEARRVYDFFASGEPKEPADVQAALESLFPESRGIDPETNLPRDLSASQIAFVDALGKLVDQEMKASKTAHPVALSRVLETIYESIIEEGRTRSDFIKQVLSRVPTEAERLPVEAQRAAVARRPLAIPPRAGVSRELTMLNRLPPTMIRGEPLRKSVPIPPPSGEVPATLRPEAMPSYKERQAEIEAGSKRVALERKRKSESQLARYLDWLNKREPLQPTPGQESGPPKPELAPAREPIPPSYAPEMETSTLPELKRLVILRDSLANAISREAAKLAKAPEMKRAKLSNAPTIKPKLGVPARKRFEIRELISTLNKKLIPINERISELTGEAVEQGPAQGELGLNPAAFFKPAAKSTYNVVKDAIQGTGRLYSEWLIDRIRRIGGPISRQAADQFNQIVSREQELYGSLTPSLDPARREAGKLGRATTWLHKISPITARAGVANVVGAIEAKTPVPSFAQRLVDLAQQANIEIGQLLQAVIPGFKATGAFARNLTAFGYDIIREGKGKVWKDWTDGLAQANSLNPMVVRGFFRKWKSILDEPMPDAARVEKVNQDFARVFPEVVTHVKVGEVGGGRWEPVVHADLFNYLENAARRATHVRSFREVFPNDPIGKRMFNAMDRAARSELGEAGQKDWDAILKGLHGHPTDSYTQFGAIRPGTPAGEAFRFVNNTLGNLMARMVLTGQMFVQPGENIAGSTPVFLGYKNYARGLAKVKQLYPEMEQRGTVNRVMYDMTFDPTAPIRSLFRIAGNTLSRAFMENALNELQEAAAAATAKVVTDRIQAGTLSSWEQRQLPLTFKAMGFTKPQVQAIMRGDVELLGQFQRKAAAFLSGGNKSIVQGSRIGANRLFNSLFRFQTYPMMKLNQFRRVAGNLGEAFKSGTPAEKLAASEQFARFMFGTTLQGALTVAITALAYEGLHGTGIRAQEAKDEPFKFMMESALSTMAGPLYLVYRGARSGGIGGVGEQGLRTLFPYSILRELTDTAQGAGQYKDLSLFDRIGKFVQQRLPGTKAIRLALSAVGLSDRDAKLESSITAFYRWRRDKMGFREERNEEKEDTRKQFRIHMKRAVEALKRGRTEEFNSHIGEAARQPGSKAGSVTQSLQARKLLKKPDGSELSPEDMDALRNHIGDDSVDMLIHYDGMLDAIAEVLGEIP